MLKEKSALNSLSDGLSETLPKYSKKHPLGKFQKYFIKLIFRNAVTSPTDNLLSPATVKVEEKRRQLLSTIKPTKLQFN
jgi:hypothetical protein